MEAYVLLILLIYLFEIVPGQFISEDDLMPQNRIVGGRIADKNSWKFIIAIEEEDFQYCAGSLVAPDCIVTAGHCMSGEKGPLSKENRTIKAGIHNLEKDEGYKFSIAEIFVYPGFDYHELKNDLAIVKLSNPVKESANVQFIKLAQTTVPNGTLCQTAGWGSMIPQTPARFGSRKLTKEPRESEEEYPMDLMETSLPFLPFNDCMQYYKQVQLDPNSVCTLAPKGTEDSCDGDSGGPLMCNGILSGITSYGFGCAQPSLPGIWTNVAMYKDWIEQTCHIKTVKSENHTYKPPEHKAEITPEPKDEKDGQLSLYMSSFISVLSIAMLVIYLLS